MGHCRGESETSVMDRGRPMKRTDGSLIKRKSIKPVEATVEELKDFETLPLGYRPLEEASSSLPCTEIENLREQAVEQASRFKVLSSKDVENLSRVSISFPVHQNTINRHRNYGASMNVATIYARLTVLFALVGEVSMIEFAPISAPPESHASHMSRS